MIRLQNLLLLLTTAASPFGLLAQTGQGGLPGPVQPPRPVGQQPTPANQPPTVEQQLQARRTTDPDLENLIPIWRPAPVPRAFQGFPLFPSKLPGYGSYPRGLNQLFTDRPVGEFPLLPVAPAPPESGWPRWLKNQSREPLPYQPDLALLVRNVDRVWWKAPDEEAFVPLYFFDKLRPVRKGTAIEVRQVGEFELLLHGGSRLIAQGATALQVDELSDTLVALSVDRLTRLRLEAFGREHRIGLPDGSTVVMRPEVRPKADEVAAEAPAAGGVFGIDPFQTATPFQPALLVFERLDEPGWRSGRATLWNGGQLPIEWQHAFGTTEIAGGERVTLLLSPPETAAPGGLASEQVRTAPDGAALRCEAIDAGEVSWSGARFRLGKGEVLRLDPLLGEPFAPPPASPPATADEKSPGAR